MRKGSRHTEESKARMRQPKTAEHRAKIAAAAARRKQSDETRAKIAAARRRNVELQQASRLVRQILLGLPDTRTEDEIRAVLAQIVARYDRLKSDPEYAQKEMETAEEYRSFVVEANNRARPRSG